MATDLAAFAKAKGVKYFMISYTDLFGGQRAKLVPAQAIAEMSVEGAGFAGFATWLDLFVLHKDDHDIGLKEATVTSLAWILLALLFSGYVYYRYGTEMWMQYITAYTMEKALSVDNLFVIIVVEV